MKQYIVQATLKKGVTEEQFKRAKGKSKYNLNTNLYYKNGSYGVVLTNDATKATMYDSLEDAQHLCAKARESWGVHGQQLVRPIVLEVEVQIKVKNIAENIKWVTKIDWDTDGIPIKELGLPCAVKIPYDFDEDKITDYLSDTYGFCVFSYKIVE